MNHLPNLTYAVRQYPQVPCLCQQRYDGLGFDTYPARCGYDVNQIRSGIFPNYPGSQIASFLQTWLYFGTLHETFNSHRKVTIEDFVEVKDNAWVITSAKLDQYVNALLDSLKVLPVEALVAEGERLSIQQDNLLSVVRMLYANPNSPLPSEVTMSISVLGLTLDCFYREFLKMKVARNWGLLEFSKQQMIQAGWCLRDLHMLETTCTELTIYYVSHLKRDFYPGEHVSCSKHKCQANQLDKKRYVTKHLTRGCTCRHMGPDVEEVKRIIRAGHIPVINLRPNNYPNDSYDLDLSVKELKSYTQSSLLMRMRIVSHVWSDGLGNPTGNTLPLCQLKFLFQSMKGSWWGGWNGSDGNGTDPKLQYESKLGWYVDPTVLHSQEKDRNSKSLAIFNRLAKTQAGLNLWIDTLCVPNGDDECRRLAIENMDKTYGAALITIVLDSELQHRSMKDNRTELLTRIALSGWMRRAWTYQEGVMATDGPLIKFSDGLIALNLLLFTDFGRNASGISSGQYAFAPTMSRINDFFAQSFPKLGPEHSKQNLGDNVMEWLKSIWETEKFIYFDLIQLFSNIRSVKLSTRQVEKGDRAKRIKSVWNALQWRNTTKSGDKFVIFNLSCCMSPQELKTVSRRVLKQDNTTTPMVAWLSHQTEIPEGMLFVKGPRLQTPNPTWAPTDVHSDTMKGDGHIERPIVTNPLGFRKPGFLLTNATPPLHTRTYLNESAIGQMFLLTLDEQSSTWQPYTIPGGIVLAVIIMDFPYLDQEVPAIVVQMTSVGQNGWRGFFRSCGELRRAHYGETGYNDGAVVLAAQGIGPQHLWLLD